MKDYGTHIFFIILALISFAVNCSAQAKKDSTLTKSDSVQLSDSINQSNYSDTPGIGFLDSFLKENKYLTANTPAVSLIAKQKIRTGKEILFYIVGITLLLLAFFKVFYTGYFNNIFRVFFNTSLRQNQLTDLLLQAKLPSLIFNIFFVISTGLYAWLILNYYHLVKESDNYIFMALSILVVGTVYFGKYLSLKLLGWISGITPATDQYIFIIFLINKIIGIILIPFIILLAFAPANWLPVIIISSFCVVGFLFLLRYLRSYGLLQTQLKIGRFHFLLYIAGMEILPTLIIYKVLLEYIIK